MANEGTANDPSCSCNVSRGDTNNTYRSVSGPPSAGLGPFGYAGRVRLEFRCDHIDGRTVGAALGRETQEGLLFQQHIKEGTHVLVGMRGELQPAFVPPCFPFFMEKLSFDMLTQQDFIKRLHVPDRI